LDRTQNSTFKNYTTRFPNQLAAQPESGIIISRLNVAHEIGHGRLLPARVCIFAGISIHGDCLEQQQGRRNWANRSKAIVTHKHNTSGRVAEWLKAPDSKSKNGVLPLFAAVDFLNVYSGFVIAGIFSHLLFLALKTPGSIKLQYQISRPFNLIFGQVGNLDPSEGIQSQMV
jgi:hypothetical protein